MTKYILCFQNNYPKPSRKLKSFFGCGWVVGFRTLTSFAIKDTCWEKDNGLKSSGGCEALNCATEMNTQRPLSETITNVHFRRKWYNLHALSCFYSSCILKLHFFFFFSTPLTRR